MVSPAKQIWKDFSSGKGGNAVNFLMEHEHYSYPEALRYLAKKYGISIRETRKTPEQKQQADERESLYIVTDFAKQYFCKALRETSEGKSIGLSYFKERGFSQSIIEIFELGYCPERGDAFTTTALKGGYQLAFLEKAGLTIAREGNRHSDRFRGRVLFPIQSFSGRTLGFGGRVLNSDSKRAKYINSPENPIYHKSELLYGIFQSKKEIIKRDNCYLVEGYTDVISLYQNGVKNAVASSGTSLTVGQIRLIKRLTPNVTLLFDGDAAGIKAALRGLDLALEQGMNVRVLRFPEGQDPDTFAQSQPAAVLRDFLERESRDFIHFKAQLSAAEARREPVKKAEAIKGVLESIAKIDDFVKRELYLRESASIFEVSEQSLVSQLHRLLHKEEKQAHRARKPQALEVVKSEALETPSHEVQLEWALLRLMLLYGAEAISIKVPGGEASYETTVSEEAIQMLTEDAMVLQHPVLRKIFEEIKDRWESGGALPTAPYFVTHPDPEIAALASDLVTDEHVLHDWKRKGIYLSEAHTHLARQLLDTVFRYKRHFLQAQLNALQAQLNTQEAQQRKMNLQAILDIKELLMALDEMLARVV